MKNRWEDCPVYKKYQKELKNGMIQRNTMFNTNKSFLKEFGNNFTIAQLEFSIQTEFWLPESIPDFQELIRQKQDKLLKLWAE